MVYDHIPAALGEVASRGGHLYVATSKPRICAERILEHFGLADRFIAVFGSELDGSLADKSELIEHVLSRAGLDPEATVMIGDREHDIFGAARNNESLSRTSFDRRPVACACDLHARVCHPRSLIWHPGARDQHPAECADYLRARVWHTEARACQSVARVCHSEALFHHKLAISTPSNFRFGTVACLAFNCLWRFPDRNSRAYAIHDPRNAIPVRAPATRARAPAIPLPPSATRAPRDGSRARASAIHARVYATPARARGIRELARSIRASPTHPVGPGQPLIRPFARHCDR